MWMEEIAFLLRAVWPTLSEIATPREHTGLEEMTEDRLKSLSEMAVGHRSIVCQLCGGREFLSRIAAMGFTVGVEVKVIQNYGRGPLITLIRDTRVALGRGEALKVLVEDRKEEARAGEDATNSSDR
jgi:ferrous iron transport protein A